MKSTNEHTHTLIHTHSKSEVVQYDSENGTKSHWWMNKYMTCVWTHVFRLFMPSEASDCSDTVTPFYLFSFSRTFIICPHFILPASLLGEKTRHCERQGCDVWSLKGSMGLYVVLVCSSNCITMCRLCGLWEEKQRTAVEPFMGYLMRPT